MSEPASPYRVTIVDTGESFPCADSESALLALSRAGKRSIPVGCRGGGCGVCKVAVLSGQFSKRRMSRSQISEQDESDDVVLACCIYPASDLSLRVIGRLQPAIQGPLQVAQPMAETPEPSAPMDEMPDGPCAVHDEESER